MSKWATEGWAPISFDGQTLSRRDHYFRDFRSLCNKALRFNHPYHGYNSWTDVPCAACRRKIEAEEKAATPEPTND